MSFRAVADALELDLPASSKLILCVLASHANEEGLCFPSIGRIAWITGFTTRQVQRVVRALTDAGIIEVVKPGGGRGHTPVYGVYPEKGERRSPFPGNGDIRSTERVTSETEKGDTMSPESVREPVIEPKKAAEPAEPWYQHLEQKDLPPAWAPLERAWTWSTPTGTKDQLYDTLLQVCSGDGGIPKTSHSYLSRFVEELRAIGATPGDIRQRSRFYRTHGPYKDWAFTPAALVKYWPFLTDQSDRELQGHRCPPHRWVDMDQDPRGRYCLACKQWEKTA